MHTNLADILECRSERLTHSLLSKKLEEVRALTVQNLLVECYHVSEGIVNSKSGNLNFQISDPTLQDVTIPYRSILRSTKLQLLPYCSRKSLVRSLAQVQWHAEAGRKRNTKPNSKLSQLTILLRAPLVS